MKVKVEIFFVIMLTTLVTSSFVGGWLVRDYYGFTAKMPDHDEPPRPTPKLDQVSVCGDENWDYVNKKITRKCIIYDRETWQNVPLD